MRLAVVHPALCRRRDHQRLAALRDCQRARYIRDVIVRRDIRLAVLYNRSARRVRARSDFRLAAGHRHALYRVRSLQTNNCCILPSVVRQSRSVIFLAVAVRRNCQRRFRNRQRAWIKCLCFIGIRYINVIFIFNRIGCRKGSSIRAARDTSTLGRRIGDGQHIAVRQALNNVIISINCFACACYSGNKSMSALFFAVVCFFNIFDCNSQVHLGNSQSPEIGCNLIVAGFGLAPVNRVSVVTASNFSLAARCRYRSGLVIHQAGNSRFCICQRRSIIWFCSTACLYGNFLRKNLQAAFSDIERNAVVVILRKHSICQSYSIAIIPNIRFRCYIVVKTRRCFIVFDVIQSSYCSPDIIQILRCIAGMADHHIIRYIFFAAISEACPVFLSGILIVCPAVRLYAYCYVNFEHFKSTADVTDLIEVRRVDTG